MVQQIKFILPQRCNKEEQDDNGKIQHGCLKALFTQKAVAYAKRKKRQAYVTPPKGLSSYQKQKNLAYLAEYASQKNLAEYDRTMASKTQCKRKITLINVKLLAKKVQTCVKSIVSNKA